MNIIHGVCANHHSVIVRLFKPSHRVTSLTYSTVNVIQLFIVLFINIRSQITCVSMAIIPEHTAVWLQQSDIYDYVIHVKGIVQHFGKFIYGCNPNSHMGKIDATPSQTLCIEMDMDVSKEWNFPTGFSNKVEKILSPRLKIQPEDPLRWFDLCGFTFLYRHRQRGIT